MSKTEIPLSNVLSATPAVNFHLLAACNARCQFCYATFPGLKRRLSSGDAGRVVDALAEAGARKITFAGGEPTLHPHLGVLLRRARDRGLVTCVVTNGYRLAALLDAHGDALDWVALSVDSSFEATQRALGRGADIPARAVQHADRARSLGIRVKLNTVVTRETVHEDMSAYVARLRPERWKILQVLPMGGQNDGVVEPLVITAEEFTHFVERHRPLGDLGITVVPEDNDAMRGSYVMVDPLGRFFGNVTGSHRESAPILEAGVARALAEVGVVPEKLVARGGVYAW